MAFRFETCGVMLAAVAATSACSVSTPPRVLAVPVAASLPAAVTLDYHSPEGQKDNPLQARLAEALARQLAQRGVQVVNGKAERVVVTLSQRSAAIGLAHESESLPGGVIWKSAPHTRHHWYDACRPQRLRAVVSWTQAGTSSPASATAELQACHPGVGQIDALARSLAAAITSQVQR